MVRGNRLLNRKKVATLIFALLMGLFRATQAGADVDSPGFLDLTRIAGCAWSEIYKPEGETDKDIKLSKAIVWELLRSTNRVWVGDILLSELGGVIGGAGASVSIKELARVRKWTYMPEAEVFAGLAAGYRPDDKCFLASVYGSVRF